MNENQSIIRKLFENFCSAWQSKNLNVFDEIMTKKLFANLSIIGPIYSREMLKVRLMESVEGYILSDFKITNHVCRVCGNEAQQSVYLSGVAHDGVRDDYLFAGTFVNHYVRGNGEWLMDRISFDLKDDNTAFCRLDRCIGYVFESNDKELAVPRWNLCINDRTVYDGCRLPVICGDLDAPWIAIPQMEGDMTDEEYIADLIYRYMFGMDHDTIGLIADILSEGGAITATGYFEFGKEKGCQALKTVSNILGYRWIHPVEIKRMEISGNSAIVDIEVRSASVANENDRIVCLKSNGKWKIVGVTSEYMV